MFWWTRLAGVAPSPGSAGGGLGWGQAAALCWTIASTAALAAPPLDYADARHLLNRAGFGATDNEIRSFVGLSREQAADRLLRSARSQAVTPVPASLTTFESPRGLKRLDDDERKAFIRRQFLISVELRNWWLQEMLETPSPLTERMTLFWHNHFVSGQEKVKSPVLMVRQNVLLRRHALGNFGKLLHEIARDPAMVVYLDNAQNRKAQPNENFAREVMELFTLGEGRYTERDIKEAARAFTGWSIKPDDGTFRYRRFQHDRGTKTVLGTSGNLDGDDVLDILLAQPACSEFIVNKLWREFVSPEPNVREVKRIAEFFRLNQYDIRTALRLIFVSDAFYAEENRAVLIKSPVDLVVGTLRSFDVQTGELTPFAFLTAALGQNLFSPPNVKGWPGGEAWINSTTLLQRKQFLDRLFRGQDMRGADGMTPRGGTRIAKGQGKLGVEGRQRFLQALAEIEFDADAWLASFGGEGASRIPRLVLAMAPVESPASGTSGLELIRDLTQDPVYQLK
jgi:uncharacterized protein (DUF1800 family)